MMEDGIFDLPSSILYSRRVLDEPRTLPSCHPNHRRSLRFSAISMTGYSAVLGR
jgi:hypothetical protein